MTTIAVTGATGHLGRLAVLALLDRGVEPSSIVAAVRTPASAQDLADRGVQVREADYGRPETLQAALAGVDRLLLVSGNEVGRRASGHRNVIDAAKTAGVSLVAYTSILNAGDTTMKLAGEHQETEEALRASGVPFVLLRNGWYTENYTAALAPTLEHGALLGASTGEGRVAPAARQDYAEAAAVVLTGEGHEGQAYELAGDRALTLPELASVIADAAGQPVAYAPMAADEYAGVLAGAGVPAPMAEILADSDLGIDRGELVTDRDDLRRLIGRPTTPVEETIAAALPAAAA
ncbi:SDR family oxidoreductase [Patulibacter sp. SYSU D01012]|uniref:SDR family oxidoreductase n=1 Tax=Patulibacter sp. SYSU D01012 TaxID=2817381 RepID=UPI001B30D59C|nr:SDR family oxidoreductase [Patulibacter sp. SYSU D01012]